jgi:hypothetical protein
MEKMEELTRKMFEIHEENTLLLLDKLGHIGQIRRKMDFDKHVGRMGETLDKSFGKMRDRLETFDKKVCMVVGRTELSSRTTVTEANKTRGDESTDTCTPHQPSAWRRYMSNMMDQHSRWGDAANAKVATTTEAHKTRDDDESIDTCTSHQPSAWGRYMSNRMDEQHSRWREATNAQVATTTRTTEASKTGDDESVDMCAPQPIGGTRKDVAASLEHQTEVSDISKGGMMTHQGQQGGGGNRSGLKIWSPRLQNAMGSRGGKNQWTIHSPLWRRLAKQDKTTTSIAEATAGGNDVGAGSITTTAGVPLDTLLLLAAPHRRGAEVRAESAMMTTRWPPWRGGGSSGHEAPLEHKKSTDNHEGTTRSGDEWGTWTDASVFDRGRGRREEEWGAFNVGGGRTPFDRGRRDGNILRVVEWEVFEEGGGGTSQGGEGALPPYDRGRTADRTTTTKYREEAGEGGAGVARISEKGRTVGMDGEGVMDYRKDKLGGGGGGGGRVLYDMKRVEGKTDDGGRALRVEGAYPVPDDRGRADGGRELSW